MWSHNGIGSELNKPSPTGAYEDSNISCIILGGSKEVWKDYKKAKSLFDSNEDYHIYAINHIASIFRDGRVQGIVSLHGEMCGPLRKLREVFSTSHSITHSNLPHEGVDIVWGELTREGGTSGLFAVKIALAMGYQKIIVCGCGIDNTGHFYDPEDPTENGMNRFDEACRMPWKSFHKSNVTAQERVRIMSGILRKTYGEPTKEWVNEIGVLNGN